MKATTIDSQTVRRGVLVEGLMTRKYWYIGMPPSRENAQIILAQSIGHQV